MTRRLRYENDSAENSLPYQSRLTDCCGAYSTYYGAELYCKKCGEDVPVGQGDGGEVLGDIPEDLYRLVTDKRRDIDTIGWNHSWVDALALGDLREGAEICVPVMTYFAGDEADRAGIYHGTLRCEFLDGEWDYYVGDWDEGPHPELLNEYRGYDYR